MASSLLPRASRAAGAARCLITIPCRLHEALRPPSARIGSPAHLNAYSDGKLCRPFDLQHPFFGINNKQRAGFSSSSSTDASERNQATKDQGAVENADASHEIPSNKAKGEEATSDPSSPEKPEESDEEGELSIDDLVKLVEEKEELLKLKHKEIEKMQDKVLRSYAEMENVIDRTRREAENSKKFAIQNFAKSLLDVADNLGRASSVVKESFSKLDTSKDSIGAVPLLKTLLEGVEMTDKQLAEAFRKYGVEKFDPMDEHFDPHRHHAVFQIPSSSKPPGTVASVLKHGYMLYDRVIRPAEVGVTEAVSNNADKDSAE